MLKHKIQLAQKLSLADWFTLIEAWWLLLFCHFALLVTSYARLDDSARQVDSLARGASRARADAEQLHRLIYLAAQIHLIPMSCLVQSLTLKKMLGARNIPAQVRIGAQKTQGSLHAHAWVEVDQMPIGEADDVAQRFGILSQMS